MKTPAKNLYRQLLLAGLVAGPFVLTPATQAQTNLNWLGGNGTNNSWGAGGNFNAAFVSSNNTNLTFDNMTRATDNSFGASRTVRSITFGNSINGNWTTATTNSTVLTFAAASGNASLNVLSGTSGNITFGPVGGSVTGSLSLTSNLEINHDGSGLLLIRRQIGGAGGLIKNGTGTFEISAPNNNGFTGAVTVNAGRLVMGSTSSATGDAGLSSGITLNGGELEIKTTSALNKTVSPNLTVSASSKLVYNNVAAGDQSFTLNTGAMVLNGDLTVQNISSNSSANNAINISRNLTGSGNLTVDSYNNVASGAVSFSNGRVQLSGDNTAWTGNLVIAKGTAQFSGANSLGGTGSITLGTTDNAFGAGLGFNTGNTSLDVAKAITVTTGGVRLIRNNSGPSTTANLTLSGPVTLQGDLTLDHAGLGDGSAITVSGNVTGAGGLNVTFVGPHPVATSSVRLTGTNNYSGATTIGANATLSASGGSAIGNSSAVTLAGSGSTFNVLDSETVGSLASASGVGSLVLTGSLTTGGNNQSTTYGGNSTGAGGLTKVGSGTMTLSGSNGYTGATNVNEGTLIVSGSIASSVTTIAPGAVLSFTGSASAGNITIGSGASFALGTAGLAGAVTINGGTFTGAGTVASLTFTGASVFAPGNSPGTVTIADGGTLTMSSSTVSNFEITSSDFTPGSYDLVIGTVGGSPESVAFDGILNIIFSGSGYSVSATAVKLFDVDNYSGSFSAVNVSGLDAGLVATFNSSTGFVEIAAIPEPSSVAVLVGFGALGFVAYRRRRHLVKAA
jgi:autotransporter-associated beta strand protein